MPDGQVYESECGLFLCRMLGGGRGEAWLKDGSIHWRNDDRMEDAQRYPLPYGVGGCSATMAGQKKGSFTLSLLKCDTNKLIEPFTGNTVLESQDVVFRRKVVPQNVPRWMRIANA